MRKGRGYCEKKETSNLGQGLKFNKTGSGLGTTSHTGRKEGERISGNYRSQNRIFVGFYKHCRQHSRGQFKIDRGGNEWDTSFKVEKCCGESDRKSFRIEKG